MVLIQWVFFVLFRAAEKSRGDWIRTSDLLFPKQAHYQAVLRPVRSKTGENRDCPPFPPLFQAAF